jgi:hypothetical protein
MYKLKTLVVISTLIAVLAGVSPTMLAQNKEPDKPTDRNSASPGANGNILWQYNTHG